MLCWDPACLRVSVERHEVNASRGPGANFRLPGQGKSAVLQGGQGLAETPLCLNITTFRRSNMHNPMFLSRARIVGSLFCVGEFVCKGGAMPRFGAIVY